MFIEAFKRSGGTWENDIRVGVVERESLEEDIIEVVKNGKLTITLVQDHCCQDSSGFCVPVTNKLVQTAKIISKDSYIAASDLGISRMEQLEENRVVEVEKETNMGTSSTVHSDETLVYSRLEGELSVENSFSTKPKMVKTFNAAEYGMTKDSAPFLPAGKEYYIARSGVGEMLNCSIEQVNEEQEPDNRPEDHNLSGIMESKHGAVVEDGNLLGEVVEQGEFADLQDASSSTFILSTGNLTKCYSNSLSIPAAEFEMKHVEEVGDVEQGLIALEEAPVLGSAVVQSWIENERTEIKLRGVAIAKYQGYLKHTKLSDPSLEEEEKTIGMARDIAECNIAKKDIKPIIIADQSQHFKKSYKTRNRSWWWWVLTIMVFISNMTTKLISYQDPGFGVQPGSVNDKTEGLSGMGLFMDLEGEMENNTLEVYDKWVEAVDGHSLEDLFMNHFILGEGDMMGIRNKIRFPNLMFLGMEMHELTATADEANSLVTTGVETEPIMYERLYLGDMEEEVTDGIMGPELSLRNNTHTSTNNYVELPEEHVLLGEQIETWDKTGFSDREEVMNRVEEKHYVSDVPCMQIEEGERMLLISSLSHEESLAFSEVDANMVNWLDQNQDNHIGLVEEKTYEAVLTGSGAAGDTFSQTGGGEEEMFKVTVTEAVEFIKAALRVVAEYEAVFTESGAVENPFSQTGGGEGVMNKMTVKEVVADMTRDVLRDKPRHKAGSQDQKYVFFLALFLAALGCSLCQFWFGGDDPHKLLVDGGQVHFRGGISYTNKKEVEKFKGTKVGEMKSAKASSECLAHKSPEIGHPAADADAAAKGPRVKPKDKPEADILYAAEVLSTSKISHMHAANEIWAKQAVNLRDAQGNLKFSAWGEPHDGLVSHAEQAWDYLPYNNVSRVKVEYDEVRADHMAARECLNLACRLAYKELEHNINIGEERKQVMIQKLGLLMDDYVSMYSDHESLNIRLRGQSLPVQIETRLWEMNEAVEEVKDTIRDHTSRNSVTMSKERETLDNHHPPYHKWPDIMEESAGGEKSRTIPSQLPIPSYPGSPGTLPTSPSPWPPRTCSSCSSTSPTSSSPCSPRTCPCSTRTPSTSPCRTSGCCSVPGMLGPNRRGPGLCTASPGMRRRRTPSPSSSPWSSSRG